MREPRWKQFMSGRRIREGGELNEPGSLGMWMGGLTKVASPPADPALPSRRTHSPGKGLQEMKALLCSWGT